MWRMAVAPKSVKLFWENVLTTVRAYTVCENRNNLVTIGRYAAGWRCHADD